MLVILKNQLNQLCISASEKVTLESPNFLFVFTHEMQEVDTPCILTNTSEFTQRYDLFPFTEGVDAELVQTGSYTLKVYEQESPTNLDPNETTGLVHQESVLVKLQNFVDKENNPEIIGYIYEFS